MRNDTETGGWKAWDEKTKNPIILLNIYLLFISDRKLFVAKGINFQVQNYGRKWFFRGFSSFLQNNILSRKLVYTKTIRRLALTLYERHAVRWLSAHRLFGHSGSLFKVPMKQKLSLSYLKEVLKRQNNILCSFSFPCFVFEISSVCLICKLNILTSHVRNDLSEKVIYIYLCYYQTKLTQRNQVRVFLPQHHTCRLSSDLVW